MFWYILLGLCIVITTIIFIYVIKEDSFEWVASWFLSLVLCALIIIVCVSSTIINNKKIETFKKQKYYIEQVAPTLPETDNYAITLKRIELNEWLYNAQYEKEHYEFFNFWSDEVLKLEAIK